jgi:hypothetical protein
MRKLLDVAEFGGTPILAGMAQSAENRLDVYTDTNMCKLLGA